MERPEPDMAVPASRTVAVAVAGLLALAAALAGIDARATYGARVTADEPQYLLTAQSLADDGDLDISDEIAERSYLPYHEITVDRQTSVLDDGREISPHDPLLPLLLALPMTLGGWLAAKAAIAALAAMTAATTAWVAIRRFRVDPSTATVVTAAAFAGLPLAGYGTQVYPEMAAALCTIAAVAALTSDRLERRHVALALGATIALPWLAVKYVPVAAVAGIALLARLEPQVRRIAVGVLGLAGATYLLAHRVWYGGWTVYATGDHFEETGEFSVVGTRVDLIGRSRRVVGLLVDREFGLIAWSPIWLLVPIAFAVLIRRRPPGWWLVVALVAAGWSNATFVALTMHGWWVPGRQLVVVLPVAAVAIASLGRDRLLRPIAAVAGLLGAVNWVWLATEASTDRRTLVVDFMETSAWPYRAWRWALPSGIDDGVADRGLLLVWALVVAALMVVAARPSRRLVRGPTSTRSPASPGAAPR